MFRLFRPFDKRYVVTFICALLLSKIKNMYWRYVMKNSLKNALQFNEESRDLSLDQPCVFWRTPDLTERCWMNIPKETGSQNSMPEIICSLQSNIIVFMLIKHNFRLFINSMKKTQQVKTSVKVNRFLYSLCVKFIAVC